MTNHPTRPDCWEFAMSFLGDPEETEIRKYVEALEAAQRPFAVIDTSQWTDEERQRASGFRADPGKWQRLMYEETDPPPADSLVERVAKALIITPHQARAAIREVAAWIDERTGTIANGSQWASMLRDEADK